MVACVPSLSVGLRPLRRMVLLWIRILPSRHDTLVEQCGGKRLDAKRRHRVLWGGLVQ